MAFDFETLGEKIEIAARLAFITICQRHGAEGIYGFALYSDDGAMTVCAAANALEHLENADLDDASYYKFEPAEWKYEGSGFDEADELFADICTSVRTRVFAMEEEHEDDDSEFTVFRSQLFETCIGVLKKLTAEGFFREVAGRDVFVVFTATEYEFPKAEMRKIAAALNSNPFKDEYLAWMKTWAA
jgi:hypothetical protein